MNEAKAREALRLLQEALGESSGAGSPPPAYSAGNADKDLPVKHTRNDYGKEIVEITDRSWFTELSLVMRSKADPGEREKIESLSSGINNYGSLTPGQWRMFKAIHKTLFGSWPTAAKMAAPVAAGPLSDDELPF